MNPRARGTNSRANGTNPRALATWFEDVFWPAYPRKKSKQDALKAINSLKPDEETRAAIMAGLEKAKQSDERFVQRGEVDYRPYPATWLRDQGWKDEHDSAAQDDDWRRLAR